MNEDRATFRYAIGGLAICGGLAGLAGLYFIDIPAGNDEPLLLALGIVLWWGATVIGYEFGSSPSGRKAADAGIANQTSPQPVKVVNPPEDPVQTEESK